MGLINKELGFQGKIETSYARLIMILQNPGYKVMALYPT